MKKIQRRVWLNPDKKNKAAYMLWEVNPYPKELNSSSVVFVVADCNRKIDLDFSVYSKESRDNAIVKAKILQKEINDFVLALETLVKEIDNK